ncbi:MAG: hypothetical protein ACI87E_003478 [Mariniblastus sp.]
MGSFVGTDDGDVSIRLVQICGEQAFISADNGQKRDFTR